MLLNQQAVSAFFLGESDCAAPPVDLHDVIVGEFIKDVVFVEEVFGLLVAVLGDCLEDYLEIVVLEQHYLRITSFAQQSQVLDR